MHKQQIIPLINCSTHEIPLTLFAIFQVHFLKIFYRKNCLREGSIKCIWNKFTNNETINVTGSSETYTAINCNGGYVLLSCKK